MNDVVVGFEDILYREFRSARKIFSRHAIQRGSPDRARASAAENFEE